MSARSSSPVSWIANSYGADIRFGESEVDQARAAGVVIEFERGWPLIVDRSLYREPVKQAITRTVTDLETRLAERAAEKSAQRHATAELPADPGAEARREEQRAVREIGETAHGVNLDLGAGLLTGLSTVDPADMTVARFFVLGRYRPSTNYADFAAMPMRHRSVARRKALGRRTQPRGATCSWR